MSLGERQLQNSGILYIGSYGDKGDATVHVVRQNRSTGELAIHQRVTGIENASYLALHPQGNRLYAAKEIGETDGKAGGSVVAIEIDELSGLLKGITSSSLTEGAHPCYISVDSSGKALFAANYSGGNVALLPITTEGELEPASSVKQHESAPGPVANRQEAPHAHCITPMPGGPYVCAVDLGMDAIVTYRYDPELLSLTEHSICKLHGGAGPRHIVFHGRLPLAYVANELESTVTQLHVDAEQGTLTAGATISTIPSDYKGYNDAADIHISMDGRYLYSSNRGHNSITVYAIDQANGQLTAVQHSDCGGEQPRNFGITPDGQFLLAANQKSGTVVVFHIDKANGKLSPVGCQLELPNPVCIRFSRSF